MKAVNHPSQVFPSWKSTAFLVGSLTLILEVLSLTPLTFLQVARWPMHLPTLAVFVIVSLNYLIPAIVQGRSILKDTLKIVGVVIALKFALILLVIGVLITLLIRSPDTLDRMLEDAVAVIARYAGEKQGIPQGHTPTGFDDLNAFVIQASIINLAQLFIIPIVLLGGFTLVTFLLRRLFLWYGFPQAKQRLMKVATYGVIGAGSLFLGLAILPFMTNALLKPENLLKPLHLIFAFWGLAIAAVGLIFFYRASQKYANRCSNCGGVVQKPYEFGKRCETCHELLHPWLIGEYET